MIHSIYPYSAEVKISESFNHDDGHKLQLPLCWIGYATREYIWI